MTTEEAKKIFENGLENITKTNRLIEFRGKQKYTKEWVYGYYAPFFDEDTLEFIPAIISLSAERLDICPVIPETVAQFTGLTDKNGEKVFKDDIIAFLDADQKEHIEGAVKYGKFNCGCCEGVYGWFIEGGDIRYFEEGDYIHFYVKGNIHDNPELLKEGTDDGTVL